MPIFSIGERTPRLIGEHHYVAHDATIVGDVVLENNVNVWFQVVIRAENDRVHVGEGCNIQDGSVLHVDPGFPLTLDKHVSIGHKVMLHGCSVGEGTLIGANTLIPEGKVIPDGVLVVGSPGKVVRQLEQKDRDYLLKIATGYVERSRHYKASLRQIT